nr:hypothetical protein CFP56_62236 [Quercus suber]
MKIEVGVPDSYTYPSIIKACSTQCEVSLGSALHVSALSNGCRVCNCWGFRRGKEAVHADLIGGAFPSIKKEKGSARADRFQSPVIPTTKNRSNSFLPEKPEILVSSGHWEKLHMDCLMVLVSCASDSFTEQLELQFLSDELDIAITDHGENPWLERLLQRAY